MARRRGAPEQGQSPQGQSPQGAALRPAQVARAYTPTALPSVAARALAFIAIILGGFSGGLIGYAITDLQCGTPDAAVELDTGGEPIGGAAVPERDPNDAHGCGTVAAVGGLIGAGVGAGGVAVVSVLVLRAMAEWRKELEIDEDDEPDRAPGNTSPPGHVL